VRIWDPIENARQEAFAQRGPAKCRVCRCEISPEKRRGRPRLTCVTCDVFQTAVAMIPPEPRSCEWCRVDFRPQRDTARFCSDACRRGAFSERRRSWAFKECQGCGMPLMGRARRYCTGECCQRHRSAQRRKNQPPSSRTCLECCALFMPRRAGVIYCSRVCAKRRADRNYRSRHRT
jgi:hypothetical protein